MGPACCARSLPHTHTHTWTHAWHVHLEQDKLSCSWCESSTRNAWTHMKPKQEALEELVKLLQEQWGVMEGGGLCWWEGWGGVGWGLVPMETVQSAHLHVLCAVLAHWHPVASPHHSWTWQHACTCKKHIDVSRCCCHDNGGFSPWDVGAWKKRLQKPDIHACGDWYGVTVLCSTSDFLFLFSPDYLLLSLCFSPPLPESMRRINMFSICSRAFLLCILIRLHWPFNFQRQSERGGRTEREEVVKRQVSGKGHFNMLLRCQLHNQWSMPLWTSLCSFTIGHMTQSPIENKSLDVSAPE